MTTLFRLALRVVGLQIRRDDPRSGGKYIWFSSANKAGGTSSGAPVHFSRPHLLRDAYEVVITEGILKADIISFLTQSPVIAAAGVTVFGSDFANRLKEKFPHLRTTTLAFDMDLFDKPQVADALDKLAAQLERIGFSVRVRTWGKHFKGLDDYLVAQINREEVAA